MDINEYQHLLIYALKHDLNKYITKTPIQEYHLGKIIKCQNQNIGYNSYILEGHYGIYTNKFEYQLIFKSSNKFNGVYANSNNNSVLVEDLLGKELQELQKLKNTWTN